MTGWIPISNLFFWCQKILPLVYDNSLSYMELLCKVIEYLNNMINDINLLRQHADLTDKEIEALKADVEQLKIEFKKVADGEYVSLYINALAQWIDSNLQELVGRVVKYVFFGLSDDGYFVAYIPDTWDFITFDTILDQNSPLYGHLILQW